GKTRFGISKLDEDSLKALSYNTLGEYFNVQNESALLNSFEKIVQLTKKMGAIDMSFYFIMLTLVIFVLKQFLIDVVKIRI
ncbi:hypothetical protein K9M41_04565, partial [Candidatus Gracilibacteria bacterium]|nr:hypothetical protein [Candidatus Gracilibacteria bacterium]